MKLWIDDVRPAPEGWVWADNYEDAIEALEANQVTDASFDHDLGFYKGGEDILYTKINANWNDPTGYDIIKWVAEHDKWPLNSCSVHSANPVGRARICGIIERYSPYDHREHILFGNLNAVWYVMSDKIKEE